MELPGCDYGTGVGHDGSLVAGVVVVVVVVVVVAWPGPRS